ncbi:helix-turn-helix domain-containing protein [Fulvivirga lutea]|uniref:Helix-turn-helix domain-containing protein n=1 Tax=Fulvivirga lutea TaxID=2810512 RepID=A0A975A0J7_9BACT|nr:helix-turn-helix domain-containing protein [Fulvivirga lutea]QSE97464.1 helix-turn-helix domain-containing protein [Fulvivirga lutea]
MVKVFEGKEFNSLLALLTNHAKELHELERYNNLISILWNRCHNPVTFYVDGAETTLLPNQITTYTYLHVLKFPKDTPELTSFNFNREFYCIIDHDQEVSCNGILFFGSSNQHIIDLVEEEIEKFEMLFHVFVDEFSTRDNIQEEMLRMLLKRLIIKVTRIAKKQIIQSEMEDSQIDLIRKFNVLVEQNYKLKHQVSDYAELLFKSPKTLSNLFSKFSNSTPLQIIQERIILEGKRLLLYTDKSVKEIAYELGFEDAGSFHKVFKRLIKQTPLEFKQQMRSEKASVQ